MIATDLARKVMRLEYQAVRAPLQAVQSHLIRRYLAEDSALRLGLERGLGSLDAAAGRVLHDRGLAGRGESLQERTDTMSRAVELDADARQLELQAEQAAEEGAKAAAQRRRTAQSEQRERVAAAVEEKKRAQERATEAAATAAAIKQRRADARANSELQDVRQQRATKQTAAARKAQAAAAAARPKLESVAAERAGAAAQRADARTLSALAKNEQQKRQQG